MNYEKEYRTPSGRLAPHPNMTDDELDDYEDWDAKQVPELSWWVVVRVLLMIAFLVYAFIKAVTS